MEESENVKKEIVELFESRFESYFSRINRSSFVLEENKEFDVFFVAVVEYKLGKTEVNLQHSSSKSLCGPSSFYSTSFEAHNKTQLNKLKEVLNNIDIISKTYICYRVLYDYETEPEIIFKNHKIVVREVFLGTAIIFDLKNDKVHTSIYQKESFRSSDFFKVIEIAIKTEGIDAKRNEARKYLDSLYDKVHVL